MNWMLEIGEFDALVIDKDGTLWAEYYSGGCLHREQIKTSANNPIKLGATTGVSDFRRLCNPGKYKIKHK